MAESHSDRNVALRPELSIVTTMYRSERYLREFHRRASEAAMKLFSDIEFVYVNDGSPDGSLAEVLEIQRNDPRLRVVDLSRNFGHHYAILAGLEYARGQLVFLIDCDLEEDPGALVDLVFLLRQANADVAFGVQRERKGGMIERFGGSIAYGLVDLLSRNMHLQRDMLLARVMSRAYVDRLLEHRERAIVFAGLASLTGFRQVALTMQKKAKGATTYGIWRRAAMLIRAITEFSDRPLHFIAYLGGLILVASFVFIVYLLVTFAVYRTVPAGYTSLAASIWFLGGLILFSIGIVAIYLSVIFIEVKGRPRYIVRAVYDSMRLPRTSELRSTPTP